MTTTHSDTMTRLGGAALPYAEHGWHLLPLRPDDKRPAFPKRDANHCAGTGPRCRGRHMQGEERAPTDPDRIGRPG